MKEGYKQTELGIIPENWEIKRLGEVSNINMGQSPSSESYNSFGTGLPLIQGNADIINGKSVARIYTTEITKIANMNELIFTVRAPVGAIGIATEKSCIGRGVCSIWTNKCNIDFIKLVLLNNKDKRSEEHTSELQSRPHL